MKLKLIGILTLNVFDYYSTLLLLKKGALELNPLLRTSVNNYSFPLIKLFILPLIILILIIYHNRINKSKICKENISFCLYIYSLLFLYHCIIHIYI
ncbi:MAG: DUF5658 family protein [Bacillota bacterium]